MTDKEFVRERFPTVVVQRIRRGDGAVAYITNVGEVPDSSPTAAAAWREIAGLIGESEGEAK